MIAKDSSGNGYDGLYSTDSPFFVAGCVPGDLACDFSGVASGLPGGGDSDLTVALPVVPTQWTLDWSLEVWLRGTSEFNDSVLGTLYFARGPAPDLGIPSQAESIYVDMHSVGIRLPGRGGSYWRVAEDVPNDGGSHHLVITYTPHAPAFDLIEADVVFYLDGTALTLTDEAVVTVPHDKVEAWIGGIESSPDLSGVVDEFAVYPTVLSSGDVSAHHSAASTSFAAYTAAVLADGPTVYYHLNDQVGGWHVGRVGMAAS